MKLIWNQHHVRQSSSKADGKPNVLFSSPEVLGYQSQGIEVNQEDIDIVRDVIGFRRYPTWKDYYLHLLLQYNLRIYNIDAPTSAEDGLDTYVELLGHLQRDEFEI